MACAGGGGLSCSGDMPDNAPPVSHTLSMADTPHLPRRIPAAWLLASVALHALLLILLPGWRTSMPLESPRVLDVALLAPEQPPVSALPAVLRPPAAAPAHPVRRVIKPPPRAVPAAAVVAAAVAPAPDMDAAPAAAPAPLRNDAQPDSRGDVPVAPAPLPAAVTPPAFNVTYLRNPPPAYPVAARRNGDEGTVLLRVLVGRDGAPLKVELDRTSQSRALDAAALDAVRNWRFMPARRGAVAIEDWVRVPVVFRLES